MCESYIWRLRVGLDYGEEVHQSRLVAQDKVNNLAWHTRWKNINKMPQFGVLRRPRFLSEGLRLPKKLEFHRTSLAKSVGMLTTMSIFHPCLKFSTIDIFVRV
jgi:hypothetical protein